MPELEYFVVCRHLSTDIETDELTFGGVLEDIFPIELPMYLERAVAISCWRLTKDELESDFQTILRVTPPGANDSVDFAMNLSRGRTRHHAIQSVFNIPMEEPGTIIFEALLNGRHEASHHVEVHSALQPDESGRAEP